MDVNFTSGQMMLGDRLIEIFEPLMLHSSPSRTTQVLRNVIARHLGM